VRVLVDFIAEGGVRCEYATTLGAGGMFVETEEPIPLEAALKARFRLPGSDVVHEIEGRVAWTQGAGDGGRRAPGMGVEFTDSVAVAALARELERLP
jgi:type IV pilus assembly protein PilZ